MSRPAFGPTELVMVDLTAGDIHREVLEAEQRIRLHIRETPLEPSPWLSRQAGCEVYLKLENLQITSSFKYRGALNKILSLGEEDRQRGLVTASSGNHGSAMAYLLRKFGLDGTIYVPETVSPAKLETLRTYQADVVLLGSDGIEAERAAREIAEREGRLYISPYNDLQIIGGQGTIGLELERQLEGVDAVFCPVGGGGLVAGIAGYLKSSDAQIRFIGCQPRNSCVMYASVRAGRIVDQPSSPTLADGTAGGIEAAAITYSICRDLVDEFVLVEEPEIGAAIRTILTHHHLLIEGAAALSVAALLRQVEPPRGARVVLILSGARIGLETLRSVLEGVV
jgi:threonine dehydratase